MTGAIMLFRPKRFNDKALQMARHAVLCVPSFLMCTVVSTKAPAQNIPVRRDQQAITVIQATLTATGWTGLSATDAVAECSVVSSNANNDQKQIALTIRAMPHHRVRYETPNLIIVRDGQTLTRARDGHKTTLPAGVALSALPEPFPFWTVWQDWNLPKTTVQYKGTELIDGQLADKVLIIPHADPSIKNGQLLSQFIFLVSQTSHLPIELRYNTQAGNSPLVVVPTILKWSNYQLISGITVPASVHKYLNGSLVTDLTVTGVNWNTGLTPTTFSLQ